MNTKRLEIAVLFIIIGLSNMVTLLIELLRMSGQLFGAIAEGSGNAALQQEFQEIADGLLDPSTTWIFSILFILHLITPLMILLFTHPLATWTVFVLGSLLTAFGTIHSIEHGLAGEVHSIVLSFLTLTIPGTYGVVLSYKLARSAKIA